jgi:hypothetical protein
MPAEWRDWEEREREFYHFQGSLVYFALSDYLEYSIIQIF